MNFMAPVHMFKILLAIITALIDNDYQSTADYAEEIIISSLFLIFCYWVSKKSPESITELTAIIN